MPAASFDFSGFLKPCCDAVDAAVAISAKPGSGHDRCKGVAGSVHMAMMAAF